MTMRDAVDLTSAEKVSLVIPKKVEDNNRGDVKGMLVLSKS
jgi:hypothetical protein